LAASIREIFPLPIGGASDPYCLAASGRLPTARIRDARGVDLVVGAKRRPMQLILAGIYQLEAPPGRPLAAAQALATDPIVRRAVPACSRVTLGLTTPTRPTPGSSSLPFVPNAARYAVQHKASRRHQPCQSYQLPESISGSHSSSMIWRTRTRTLRARYIPKLYEFVFVDTVRRPLAPNRSPADS